MAPPAAPFQCAFTMRVQLSEPSLVDDLLRALRKRPDIVANREGPREIEVSLLGSYEGDAHRLAVERQLDYWKRTHPSARLQVIAGPPAGTEREQQETSRPAIKRLNRTKR